ncbi:MAG: helicase, partial [Proteobacteria bacterium]|nr:helicase [Pseudomonadota bacterium]
MNSTTLRNELTSLINNDLVGPAAGPNEEVNESRLSDRYLLGVLAPARRRVDPVIDPKENTGDDAVAHRPISEGEDGDEAESDNDSLEGDSSEQSTVASAAALLPSSLGLTCSILPDASSLIVQARWGEYAKGSSVEHFKEDGEPERVWVRTPREFVSSPIPLREGAISEWMPHPDRPDIFVKGVIRKLDGSWIVSLFLVNNQVEPEKLREEAWLFQAELSVRSADGKPIFCKRLTSKNGILSSDPELRTLSMLYRNRVEFAVGHGVATHAEVLPNDPTLALSVKTTALPSHEVPRVEPPSPEDIPALNGLCVDMAKLSELPREQLALSLEPLAKAYEAWIEERRREIASPATRLTDFAREA